MQMFNGLRNCIGDDFTAYLLNFVGNMCWFVVNIIATEDGRINAFNVGLSRGIITVMVSYLLARTYKEKIDFKRDLPVLNIRNIIMAGFATSMNAAFFYLEMPIVYTIFNSLPILVYVLDYLLHSTTINRNQFSGLVVCCMSMILAINSHLIYFLAGIEEDLNSKFVYMDESITTKLVASLVFLAIVTIYSYAIILTHRIKESNLNQTSFHLGIVLIMMNATGLLIHPSPQELTFSEQLGVFAVIGILAMTGSWCINASLFIGKKYGNVMLVAFMVVPISYIVSMIRYGEVPNILGVVGSAGIGIGLYLVLFR